MKYKVYLWESMCSSYPTKYHLESRDINSAKDLFQDYLLRLIDKKNTKYLDYCVKNRNEAFNVAEKVFNYRTDNWGELLDWDYIDLKS